MASGDEIKYTRSDTAVYFLNVQLPSKITCLIFNIIQSQLLDRVAMRLSERLYFDVALASLSLQLQSETRRDFSFLSLFIRSKQTLQVKVILVFTAHHFKCASSSL